jgi:hypothetical protein
MFDVNTTDIICILYTYVVCIIIILGAVATLQMGVQNLDSRRENQGYKFAAALL